MTNQAIPEKTTNEIYNILVQTCGAREKDRDRFVEEFTKDNHTWEWRFCGRLGFGGKFWDNYSFTHNSRFYVTCYSEDEVPERLGMIENANKKLQAIWEGMK